MSGLDSLEKAKISGKILEGVVTRCDRELNLTVGLGPFTATVPRGETALGIDTGATREIAVISLVGRPVSVVVRSVSAEKIILSRRAAQRAALDHFLQNRVPGDVIPATVTHLEPFGAFVDMGCGVTAMISIEKISTARIPHPAERFHPGQEIYAVVHQIDRELERFALSHRELLGTWAENAARFSPGETVGGIVRSVKPYGAFVEIAPNLSGLTEPDPDLHEGDRVSVYIKSINPDRRKIKLIVISKLSPEAVAPSPVEYVVTGGNVAGWQY